MQLLDEDAIRGIKPLAAFRESLVVHFFWPVALFAAATGISAAAAAGRLDPAMLFLAALLGGIGLVTAAANLPLLRRTNWLILAVEDAIYLKFRSYLNAHLGGGTPTVVRIGAGEIAGVRLATEKRIEHFPPARRNHCRIDHIDLLLAPGVDASDLAAALQREREFEPASGHWFGEKLAAYPVALPESGVVRIEWRSRDSAVAPGRSKALTLLSRFAPVAESVTVHVDYANKAHHEQLDALLDAYIADGKSARAVRIAQERYGLSAAEAVLFVEDRSRKYRRAER